VKAAEEHYRAATAFFGCIDGSEDENTRRTLRLLHDEHTKQAQELDRQVARLIDEGKDPSLPQKPLPSTAHSSPLTSRSDSGFRDAPSNVEESFMLLGQKNELNSSFAQFWKILEGMLDQLSQPVAFATVPLHSSKSEKLDLRTSAAYLPAPSSSTHVSLDMAEHDVERTSPIDMDESWEIDSEESFQIVGSESKPSSSSPAARPPMEVENEELKHQLRHAQSRISDLEKLMKERLAHEHQLRDSIMQAQRAISSSQMLQSITKFPGLDIRQFPGVARNPQLHDPLQRHAPPPSLRQPDNQKMDNPVSLQSRIHELEEKLRLLHVQDITQKAAIAKYKERWDKVKDSMRRKKLAKAAADVQLAAERNRIEEEVEPE